VIVRHEAFEFACPYTTLTAVTQTERRPEVIGAESANR
jgi:hypothetical protein